MSKCGSSTQYGRPRPSGTSTRRRRSGGEMHPRFEDLAHGLEVPPAVRRGRRVEQYEASDVADRGRGLDVEELCVERGQLLHAAKSLLLRPLPPGVAFAQVSPKAGDALSRNHWQDVSHVNEGRLTYGTTSSRAEKVRVRRKQLAFGAVAAMMSTALVGCGGGSDSTVLTWYINPTPGARTP